MNISPPLGKKHHATPKGLTLVELLVVITIIVVLAAVGDTANSSKDLETGWYAIWANPTKWTGSHVPAARHGGKVNICMVDGHVESLTMKELKAPDKDYTMFK